MFYLKMNIFFERAQKVTKYFGYFERNDVAKNFQKTPNPVTLPPIGSLPRYISQLWSIHSLSHTHTPKCIPIRKYSFYFTCSLKLTLSFSHKSSVARFGKISPLWRNFKRFGQKFWWFILYLAILLILLWQKCYEIEQVFIVVYGQIFWITLSILSHCTFCLPLTLSKLLNT